MFYWTYEDLHCADFLAELTSWMGTARHSYLTVRGEILGFVNF